MSLQLVAAGFFPPKGTSLEWKSDFNWQPIPYTYEKLFEDTLLLVTKSCLRFHEELERVVSEDIKEELGKYSEMFEELSRNSGWQIKSHFHIQHLFGIFKCQQELGMEIPDWAKKYFPSAMQDLMEKGFIFNSYNPQLKKLKGGFFVKKAIEDWEKKVEQKLNTKIFLYSAHDMSGD